MSCSASCGNLILKNTTFACTRAKNCTVVPITLHPFSVFVRPVWFGFCALGQSRTSRTLCVHSLRLYIRSSRALYSQCERPKPAYLEGIEKTPSIFIINHSTFTKVLPVSIITKGNTTTLHHPRLPPEASTLGFHLRRQPTILFRHTPSHYATLLTRNTAPPRPPCTCSCSSSSTFCKLE